MTIRSRLLLLLLPSLIALVTLIALFFYYNWSDEILNSFKTRLQSIVIAAAPSISSQEMEWLSQHLEDPDLKSDPRYQQNRLELVQLKQQLPIDNLYVIRIEPLSEGDQEKLTDSKILPNEGHESNNDFKQVYLLDASRPQATLTNQPGDIDFSETEEHKIYFTKKAFVTPIYKSRKTGDRFMSGYAPILDAQGNVVALLGADVSMSEIDQKLQNAVLAILLSTLLTLLMVMATVFLIAHKISKPVQQLNQAALEIAAGNYEANINAEGPKEIVELANTFNTMSECLVENISRLRESSLVRERMYGEYECAQLLQYYMLQKIVKEFQNPHLQMRLTSVNASNMQKGLLLKIDQKAGSNMKLALIEAQSQGFEPLFELNKASAVPIQKIEGYSFIECLFSENYSKLSYHVHELNDPLVWSIKEQQFKTAHDSRFDLQNQDMIFLYNSGFAGHFKSKEKIQEWFSKVLRHFSEDGLDIINIMLTNELNFLAKREDLKENFQILSLQRPL